MVRLSISSVAHFIKLSLAVLSNKVLVYYKESVRVQASMLHCEVLRRFGHHWNRQGEYIKIATYLHLTSTRLLPPLHIRLLTFQTNLIASF